jgi:hypothetical protein
MQVPIFVHSHRRSGTHSVIDTIRNHFDVSPAFRHLGEAPPGDDKPYVVKTHEPYFGYVLSAENRWRTRDEQDQWAALYHRSRHVYVYRNPFKVLISQYIFDIRGGEAGVGVAHGLTFRDYLMAESRHAGGRHFNRIEYWARHALSWIRASPALLIHFDDVQLNKPAVLISLSSHFGLPVLPEARNLPGTGVARHFTAKHVYTAIERHWDSETISAVCECLEAIDRLDPRIREISARWREEAWSEFAERRRAPERQDPSEVIRRVTPLRDWILRRRDTEGRAPTNPEAVENILRRLF